MPQVGNLPGQHVLALMTLFDVLIHDSRQLVAAKVHTSGLGRIGHCSRAWPALRAAKGCLPAGTCCGRWNEARHHAHGCAAFTQLHTPLLPARCS